MRRDWPSVARRCSSAYSSRYRCDDNLTVVGRFAKAYSWWLQLLLQLLPFRVFFSDIFCIPCSFYLYQCRFMVVCETGRIILEIHRGCAGSEQRFSAVSRTPCLAISFLFAFSSGSCLTKQSDHPQSCRDWCLSLLLSRFVGCARAY